MGYERPFTANGTVDLEEVVRDLLDLNPRADTSPRLLEPLTRDYAPSANALIEGKAGTIPPAWWASLYHPDINWVPGSNAMAFRARVGTRLRMVRPTEVSWD